MPKGQDVCAANELMPGDMKCLFLGDTRVLLANVDGNVYATSDVCSHALAFLSEGFWTVLWSNVRFMVRNSMSLRQRRCPHRPTETSRPTRSASWTAGYSLPSLRQ
jgi:hypothetical protein